MVASAKQKLAEVGKPLEADRIVAELNFGFWSNLLNRPYEQQQVLWPTLLRAVFPYAPARFRNRPALSRRFNEIRQLRNRIFHHEPIWDTPNLLQSHANIIEAIG